jgi:hypothetical protein
VDIFQRMAFAKTVVDKYLLNTDLFRSQSDLIPFLVFYFFLTIFSLMFNNFSSSNRVPNRLSLLLIESFLPHTAIMFSKMHSFD